MAGKRILIVDDHREVRRLLEAAIKSRHKDIEVVAVPSGEEASLELAQQPIDLLVADVRLPGISGLEVMRRFKRQFPVILISGSTEPKIRRQIAQAGAEAFFFKPIEITDFIDAAERALGLVETAPSSQRAARHSSRGRGAQEESGRMGAAIVELRQTLNAETALLLDEFGRVIARAGEFPNPNLESHLTQDVPTALSAGVRIARLLGNESAHHLQHYAGEGHHLFLCLVGETRALLVITRPQDNQAIGEITTQIQTTASELLVVLNKLGISQGASPKPVEVEQTPAKPADPSTSSDPDLETIFTKRQKLKKEDVDAFWSAIPQPPLPNRALNSDTLSYDQAQQLGLAPAEDTN